MTKAKSIYIKSAALCAVLAMVLTQSARPSRAAGTEDAFKKVNIAAETRIINAYRQDLLTFLKRVDELEGKASVSKAELAQAIQTEENLKRRSQEVAGSVEAIIRKLKTAGLWTDLDTLVRAKIKNARAFSLLTQGGSVKNRLEGTAIEIRTAFPDGSIRGLTSKVIGQQIHSVIKREGQALSFNAVRVGHQPAAPRKLGRFACLVHLVFFFAKALSEEVTEDDANVLLDNCA